MRTIRALATAVAVAAALPTMAAAQHGRQFTDAWFWGVKAGGLTLADSGQAYRQAPMAGIDWLITRTHGGLYVSAAQSFFTQQVLTLRDPSAPVDSGFRVIDVKNLRRIDMAIVGFPGEHVRFHPYFGAGFSLNQIADAQARGPFGNTNQATFADQVIQDERVSFSPMVMAGGQYRFQNFSMFGQMTVSPTEKNFLLYNGRPLNIGYELGLRYNMGTSISRE